jgi:hypothetical protein
LKFFPEEKFMEKFNLTKKCYTFKTHKELDDFVINLKKTNMDFTIGDEFLGERSLLKVFFYFFIKIKIFLIYFFFRVLIG